MHRTAAVRAADTDAAGRQPAAVRLAEPVTPRQSVEPGPELITLHAPLRSIAGSPRQAAQRQQLRGAFGPAIQLQTALDDADILASAQDRHIPLNDDPALEREADLMGNRALDQPLAGPSTPAAPPAASGTAQAPVQAKGPVRLMRALNPQLPWMQQRIGSRLLGFFGGTHDPELQGVLDLIEAYDRSADGRPAHQLHLLDGLHQALGNWVTPRAATLLGDDIAQVEQIQSVLRHELTLVTAQRDRLVRLTHDENSPYEQMTDEGLLWNSSHFEHRTAALGLTGKAYFEELSRRNRQSMTDETAHRVAAPAEWFDGFVARATVALNGAVVNHYTTSTRARQMVHGGMKSKTMLEKTLPAYRHNTSAYDDAGLANSGFVFFFIEPADAPMRETRFGEGDAGATAVRISIPIGESGLLTHGWVMLSDFAQREYPDLKTTAAGDRLHSWLPTRAARHAALAENRDFTVDVRHFNTGLQPPDDGDMLAMQAEPRDDRRAAMSVVIPQTRGDAQSVQHYTGPDGPAAGLDVPDRLMNNVLVGADIIPGLATRAALEVARIELVNHDLAATLKALDGDALMRFMLKDLFRPQAMIPNQVAIVAANVQPPL